MASIPVPSLIQGISQQSDQAVGQASAKDQRNCINDLLLGARARNGTKVLRKYLTQYANPFSHRIKRSSDEDYLVLIEGGQLQIINLVDGTPATITGDISAYLATTKAAPDSYAVATVEDTTFLANRTVKPAMSTTKSAARTNWALAHFKSANYSTDYKLHIEVAGVDYSVGYKTPDNSASANADYIATNRLAEEFADAITSTLIPALTAAGKTGFSVVRRGSALRVYGGTHDFNLWTEDGAGGDQFIGFRERVSAVSDLPHTCWDGYEVAIGAEDETVSHDYYVRYEGGAQTGEWVETVKPDTETTINAATMPHLLINTGLNAFTVQAATWGTRLSGDGDRTAKDPYFIGAGIVDLQFIDARLAIIGEGWYGLSRSGNAYSFFPDTAQTTLDTDPIHYQINTGKVTRVRAAVVIGETLQFWSDKSQIRLSSGQNNIREDTVENKATTFYEYDGILPPEPFGQSSLVFGTSRGLWNNLTEVIYDGPTPEGQINVNGHCPNLISGRLRQIEVGGVSNIMGVLNSDDPTYAYIYQWYNNGSERVQSAWNYWDWPAVTKVVWMGISGSKVYALFSWGSSGTTLECLETEYIGDEGNVYIPLRADHRVNEDYVTATGDDYVEVTLPYPVPSDKRDAFTAFYRVDDEATGEVRGQILDVEWQSNTVVRLTVATPDARFWFGAKVIAYRDLPKPYLQAQDGSAQIVDRVLIESIRISHTRATTYKVVLYVLGEEDKVDEFSARLLGRPGVVNNQIPVAKSGEFTVDVGYDTEEVSIRFLNDTIYPSSWDSLKYKVKVTDR